MYKIIEEKKKKDGLLISEVAFALLAKQKIFMLVPRQDVEK